MQRRDHAGVASRADFRWRRREPGIAMARGASDLADVSDVARASSDVVIRRRHLLGDSLVGAATAAGDDDRDHERADQGRDPIG